MPSDAPASGPAPALEDPTLPLPRQQPLGPAASSRTRLLQPQQQHAGVAQTPLEMPRQAMLSDTNTGSGGASAWLQHGVVDRQGPECSGQNMPTEAFLPPFSTQKGLASGHKEPSGASVPPSSTQKGFSGQKEPFGASQVPVSAQKVSASGQKRPASGHFLLDGGQTSKHSRQITLDISLKGAPTAFGHTGRSAEGQSAGSNRQTPSGSGPAPLHWSISRQTPGSAGAAQHAKQHRAGVSSHQKVAQVLDLTQIDEEPAAGPPTNPHAGSLLEPSSARLSTDRRTVFLQSHSVSSPRKTANMVDLT